VLDRILPEPGCFIVMDRGYIDFPRLYLLHQALAYFVIRAKHNLQFRRRQSHPVDRATGVRSDQTIILTADDMIGVSTLYPTAAFATRGSIEGTVRTTSVGANGQPRTAS